MLVAPPVRGPLVMMLMVPEPPMLVPVRGPVPMNTVLRGSLYLVSGGTCWYRVLSPRAVPPRYFLRVSMG